MAATPIQFFDPHFHIWDMTPITPQPDAASEVLKRYSDSSNVDLKPTVSGHDSGVLFEPNGNKLYDVACFEKEVADASAHVEHTGGVFIEAASVCFTSTPGSNQFFADACLVESRWVDAELSKSGKSYVMMGTASLESPHAKETLSQLSSHSRMRGIRQILNASPDWPRNGMLGDLLDNTSWQEGFALLKEYGMSFDSQLNPPQFQKAALFFGKHPDIPVIINHMGCPTLADLSDPDRRKVFDDGMAALAALPHVSIKISMLVYTDPKWDESAIVVDAVKSVIKLFGCDRCMFASNFPVDSKDGWNANRLMTAFLKLVDDMSIADKKNIFAENAKRIYRV